MLLGEGAVGLGRVEGDAEDGRTLGLVVADPVTEPAALPGSSGGVGLGIEPQDHAPAAQIGEPHAPAAVVGQVEVGRESTGLEHGRRAAEQAAQEGAEHVGTRQHSAATLRRVELLDALRARRSIRGFDPRHRLSEADLRHLIGHAQLAPTSFNMQNWHFVVAVDPAVKERLWLASWKQNPVRDCSAAVVIAGDLGAHRRSARFLRRAPPPVAQRVDGYVQTLYAANPQLARDEACRSAGFAGMALMLVAKDMGLDTCPMIGFDPTQVAEALGLGAEHPPLLMVTVGKALAPPFPRTGFLDFTETVSINRFGDHSLAGAPPAD